MKRLTLDDIKIPKPDFNASKKNKGQIITEWLMAWIKHSLEFGIADFGDIIPTKEILADFLNVSPATIQNSIRKIKNLGYFISKQAIGTSIADPNSKDIAFDDDILKESLVEFKIKKIIKEENIKLNSPIMSIKELSKKIDVSQNTIRFTLSDLAQKGYFKRKELIGNKYSWIYIKEFNYPKDELYDELKDQDFTLRKKIIKKIQNYIEKTYKPGEKILPNKALSSMFEVSIKTVNDAMKVLNAKKIILSRRGRYGTIFLGKKENQKHLKSDFLSSERKKLNQNQNYNYSWQKTLGYLKKYIIENYEAGDKIDSIRKLASILNVSPNTVRRALADLFESGHLVSRRGKFGGIFILELPEQDEDKYRWLALNPDAINIKN